MKNDYFLIFSFVQVISPRFWVCKAVAYILELHEMIVVLHVVACPFVFIWFYARDWIEICAQTNEK